MLQTVYMTEVLALKIIVLAQSIQIQYVVLCVTADTNSSHVSEFMLRQHAQICL